MRYMIWFKMWVALASRPLHKLEPRPAPLRLRPFFNGWCARATETERSAVTSVIVGCFSSGNGRFSAHVCTVVTKSGDTRRASQVILAGDAATLSVNNARGTVGPHFEWKSQAHGWLKARPEQVAAEISVGEVKVALAIGGDKGWNAEGWVGRGLGWLLPCRYYVHALGAPCTITLDNGPLRPAIAHLESNYGRAFPSEWVWVQAADVSSSILIVGGRFEPFSGYTWLVALRTPDFDCDFRSTDFLSRPRVLSLDVRCASLRLDLERRFKRRTCRLELLVSAPPDSFFDDRLYVPTPKGFTDDPGSAETFDATVYARAYLGDTLVSETVIPDGALEFGGLLLSRMHNCPLDGSNQVTMLPPPSRRQ